MSIETEFESTITNVKNAYQGLDNLGATIPQNKTIENIKNCLDEIYAKFPKTDYAEGSNITLSNTLKGKLDFEDGIVGYGQTSQKSTTGKNKLQFPYIETSKTDRGITYVVNNDGTITVSGTATDNSVITLLNLNSTEFSNIRNLLLNNDCILNGCPSGGSNTSYRLQLYGYTSGGAGALADYGSGVSLSNFANETNAFNVAIFIPTGTVISTPITFKPMIRLASVTDDTYEEYTGGIPSPNPDYKQDVKVVRGKNVVDWANVNYTGQNGATITRTGSEYSVTSAGQFAFAQFSQEDLKLKPNTNYVFRAKIKSTETSNGSVIRVNPLMTVTGSEIYSSRTTSGNIAKIAFTTPSTIPSNAAVGLYPYEVSKTTVFTDIMICEGTDVNTSYLPYNTLEVVERGKNICTFQTYSVKGQFYDVIKTDQSITLKANKSYTLSFDTENTGIGLYRQAITGITWNTYGATCNGTRQSFIATIGSNDVTINANTSIVSRSTATSDTESGTITNVQLEEGSTASTFEPYITPQTHQLSLGEYEFAKIGNYVDTIEYDVDEDKVYKCENIIKKAITGNNVYAYQESASYGAYCQLYNLGNAVINIDNEVVILSNIAKGISGNDRITLTETWRVYNYQRNVFIRLPNTSTLTNLTDVRNYLNGISNIYLYYVLETPTRIEITGTLKDQIKALYYSHSFNGTTIIEIDGQLPLIIKVRALKGE